MTTGIELERNPDHAVRVCRLCDSTKVDPNGMCQTCRVPTAVSSRLFDSQNTLFLPVLGGQGAGKTTYIAMLLEMLRQGSYNIFAKLSPHGTCALQRETLQGLFERRFPRPTPESPDQWNWAFTRLDILDDRPKKTRGAMALWRREDNEPKLAARYDWCVPDWSGAAIEENLRNQGSVPAISGNLSRAKAVVLLLDATKIADESQSEQQDLLAAHLAALVHRNTAVQHPDIPLHDIPLAIVFTKTDRCRVAAEMPTQFAQRFLPKFCQFVHASFQNYKFFAVSVAGGVTRVKDEHYVPFIIQPKGIVDPFAWALYAQIYIDNQNG